MLDESFYVVLPSNASTDVFPENSQHSFKIKTPLLIPRLSGNWKVGVTEIQFPCLWKNVINGSLTVKFDDSSAPLQCNLYDGVYESIEELLKEISNVLKSAQLENDVILHYDKIRNRVILQIRDRVKGFGVRFSKNIMNMLGLSRKEELFYTSGTYVENSPDISEGFSAIYVYSDIVQSRIVGDSMSPLLRVVPIKRTQFFHRSSVYWIRFQHTEYLPINKIQTDIIEVNIRRDNGDVVPFENGKVVLTLHFKKY